MPKIQILKNMGLRYTIYRMRHEFERKCGFLIKRFPIAGEKKVFISLEEWKKSPMPFIIKGEMSRDFPLSKTGRLKSDFHNIMSGRFCFFNYEWKELGLNYDWITNPDSGFKYDINLHWSKIADFNPLSGDIKYVWEKSRFTYLLTIIRYDYTFGEDHSEFVLSEIKSWISANPINKGPNWRCSQEISLRLNNWLQALCYYKNSEFFTEDLWKDIQNVFYWSLHHIYKHIDFSRIAVRNNHAITETLTLALSNIFFPFISETQLWSTKGRKWFEDEIAYQIYEDGSFLQFSMNYHRVVIQLLSFGIAITERNQLPFSKTVYSRAYKSLDFLFQCLQEENGNLPNYGSNDGALFFPFTNADYRDFRPQLNTLHKILTGVHLYPDSSEILEDVFWVTQAVTSLKVGKKPLEKIKGPLSYPIGGYYLLREYNCFTFIRCGNHKDRPAHADNLHLDVWVEGENVLRDSGTYKYNTVTELQEYFTGTKSHNSVVVNNLPQMLKGGRFIWYFWTQSNFAGWKETDEEYIFEGEISAFRYVNSKSIHRRRVNKKKNLNKWVVEDLVDNLDGFTKTQIWHCDNPSVHIDARSGGVDFLSKKVDSFNSSYYGSIEERNGIGFDFEKSIITTIEISKES